MDKHRDTSENNSHKHEAISVSVSPCCFNLSEAGENASTLEVTNGNSFPIYFKLVTTNAVAMCLKPKCGRVEPHEKAYIKATHVASSRPIGLQQRIGVMTSRLPLEDWADDDYYQPVTYKETLEVQVEDRRRELQKSSDESYGTRPFGYKSYLFEIDQSGKRNANQREDWKCEENLLRIDQSEKRNANQKEGWKCGENRESAKKEDRDFSAGKDTSGKRRFHKNDYSSNVLKSLSSESYPSKYVFRKFSSDCSCRLCIDPNSSEVHIYSKTYKEGNEERNLANPNYCFLGSQSHHLNANHKTIKTQKEGNEERNETNPNYCCLENQAHHLNTNHKTTKTYKDENEERKETNPNYCYLKSHAQHLDTNHKTTLKTENYNDCYQLLDDKQHSNKSEGMERYNNLNFCKRNSPSKKNKIHYDYQTHKSSQKKAVPKTSPKMCHCNHCQEFYRLRKTSKDSSESHSDSSIERPSLEASSVLAHQGSVNSSRKLENLSESTECHASFNLTQDEENLRSWMSYKCNQIFDKCNRILQITSINCLLSLLLLGIFIFITNVTELTLTTSSKQQSSHNCLYPQLIRAFCVD